jgi:AcrR family transcriptional regulator
MFKKLPKQLRRDQLLETALSIVVAEGTEALSLARLAESAGVSKPIAYEHFRTRDGLLLALFRQFDEKAAAAVYAALQPQPLPVREIAAIISDAYVTCFVSSGSAFGAILSALAATPESANVRRKWRGELADAILQLLHQHASGKYNASRFTLIGLLGAAESLSESAAHGEISKPVAVATLADILVSSLESE